jgi:hypothetical protein
MGLNSKNNIRRQKRKKYVMKGGKEAERKITESDEKRKKESKV